ncbi:MAG: hypothetical protein QM726_00020 [Chitinophagaceae bacterium]
MNLRQPYEQVIADKLRQLRPPDANASWQQMKRLLDEEDNKGAGGKRPPGNNGWWRIGMLAIVLITSAWLFLDQKNQTNQLAVEKTTEAAPVNASKTSKEEKNNKTQTTSIENNTTLTSTDNNNNAVAKNNTATNLATANTASNSNATSGTTVKENSAGKIPAPAKEKINPSSEDITSSNAPAKESKPAKNTDAVANNTTNALQKHNSQPLLASNLATGNHSDDTKNLSAKSLRHNNHHQLNAAANESSDITHENSTIDETIAAGTSRSQQLKNASGKKNLHNKNHLTGNNNNSVSGDTDGGTATNNAIDYIAAQPTVNDKQKSWFERLTELKQPEPTPSYNTDALATDSIASNSKIELNVATKKAIAKAKRDNEIALLDKKDKKSLHLNLSNLFKPFSMRLDAEPWWAAGLAVNGNIPLSSQSRFNYNMNAKSGTLTDYIPSPYLQFHLNNYVYFQTELNFVSPQFTPQLLAFRQSNDVTGQSGMSEQKSIFIQKMYYFNWPFSLHYSPVSNLYFSAGIQFSSFQSGLASIESKEYVTTLGVDHPNNTYTEVLKFKDDSIAAKIAPNEWRWQLGAEYYFNRFSVGLRYNQSFKNAINSAAAPSLAPTVFRNQSMLFFIRYNLFESRTKQTVPKNQ